NMAVEMVLLMVLVSASLVNSQDEPPVIIILYGDNSSWFWNHHQGISNCVSDYCVQTGGFRVDCRPAVGVVGETTEISCSYKTGFPDQDINIYAVRVKKITKRGERDPVFWIKNGKDQGDPRFNLPSREDPSLQITNTALSDEGLYEYMIFTNRGFTKDGRFRIRVTAKYRPPSTSTRPEKIVDGGPAEFHCSASGGYPAGTIHWFDGTGTNWTNRATLEITEGEDKLVHLSSRLSFTKIDSSWGRFRCEVLNSRFITEGESTFREAYRGECVLYVV
ncbi:hypothetical protein NFI96_030189, partial [Prochilodus magdalenae]